MREPSFAEVGIVDAAYHLPGEALDIGIWGPRVGLADALVARLLQNGCQRFHAATGESDADLVVRALEQLLQARELDPTRIAYVVHAHTQSYSIPAPPQSLLGEVAARCGLQPRLALSVGELACAGIVKALELAHRLLQADTAADYAVVLSSDRVFGGPAHRVRQESGIQSDGGAVLLLGRNEVRARIRDLWVRHLPGLAAGPGAAETARLMGSLPWSHSRRVLQEMQLRGPLRLDALAALYPTNADGPYWQRLMATMGLDPALVFTRNMAERGHACCSDLAINLADDGFATLASGGQVLCFSQSNVGAYGAVLLQGVSP